MPQTQTEQTAAALPVSRHPRWIVTCNFRDFMVHDMEQMNAAPEIIHLADLPRELHRLHFLVTTRSTRVKRGMDVSFEAGRIVGRIHDALLAQ